MLNKRNCCIIGAYSTAQLIKDAKQDISSAKIYEDKKLSESSVSDKECKKLEQNHHINELSKIVLIPNDFSQLEEIHSSDELIRITAKKANTAATYSSFFRGIKQDGNFTHYYYIKPPETSMTPCFDVLHCTVKSCPIKQIEAFRVCFRLRELRVCKGNCNDCAFFGIRYQQILDAIDKTKNLLIDDQDFKGLCGRQMCDDAKTKGCPQGCMT